MAGVCFLCFFFAGEGLAEEDECLCFFIDFSVFCFFTGSVFAFFTGSVFVVFCLIGIILIHGVFRLELGVLLMVSLA